MKYACIARHRRKYSVRLMCRVLAVAASGYYAWRRCGPTARAVADERLMLNVRVAFDRSNETYGAPRVHRALRADGVQASKKRIARLMRQNGLVGHTPRRRHGSTTDSRHTEPIAPNVVERRFDVSAFDPNGSAPSTACGRVISRTCPRARDGCISRSSSISPRAAWSAGRCARWWTPSSRWRHCGWPLRPGGRPPG